MNNRSTSSTWLRHNKGMALIMVVAMLTLATVLVLGLLSVTSTDNKSSKAYSAGQRARLLADTATDIVIGQLQGASRQEGNTRTFHATQPGAARKYNANGAFIAGYKLYSDSEMVVKGNGVSAELRMVNSAPPDNWNSQENSARYVDLNEPVVRPSRSGEGSTETFFPIVDPRAFQDQGSQGNAAIEGFSYSKRTYSGTALGGVVTPDDSADANALRLPMPVQWLYVLKDGTLGHLDASNRFVSAGAVTPTPENPMVGRLAFWTDDETCKVNINTASEPTFWGVPTFLHEREWRYAEYPPAMNEYQRFPGHPATVALSTIFYPKVNLDIMTSGADTAQIRNIKERIYEIIPKINRGGSRCGTVPFGPESFGEDQAAAVDVLAARRERLFASLDELIFSETATGGKRVENDFSVDGVKLLDAASLERTRFFLTAHSRGSDVNFLGVPKVAMWPVADESKGKNFRTGFDDMIAFCSTISKTGTGDKNSYYFRRSQAHNATTDITIRRNDALMKYLDALMSKVFPAGASGNGQSFHTKYGDKDARQILVSIFDYIRTTNLYDAMLAKKPSELQNLQPETGTNYAGNYRWQYENTPKDGKTYTEERFIQTRKGTGIETDDIYNGAFPGHGAVTPAEWKPPGSNTTFRGQGRFPTISEVALHFICTGDGDNDEGSYRIPTKSEDGSWVKPPFEPTREDVVSGGKTAKKYNINAMRSGGNGVDPSLSYTGDDWARDSMPDKFLGQQKAVWYSNYPPYPQDPNGRGNIDRRQPALYGTDFNAPPDSPKHPSNHPGYKPENWNATLQRGVPLKPGEKRVQACIHLESFVSSLGWTKVHPEFTYVLDGGYINQIQVQNSAGSWVSLFSTTADVVAKSRSNIFDGQSSHPVGGVGNFRSFAVGKQVKGVNSMPDDPSYDTSASDLPHSKLDNMDLVSNFITVSGPQLRFRFPSGHFLIKVYDSHDWKRAQPVQEIQIKFPEGTHAAPIPQLVTYTSLKDTWESGGTTYTQRITDATRWWAFNYAGAMNRYRGNWVSGSVTMTPRTEYLTSSHGNYNELLRSSGRLRLYDQTSNSGNGSAGNARYFPQTYSFIWGYDPNSGNYKGINPRARDPRLTDNAWGTDVIRSVMPRHGDYRILAGRKLVTEDFWVPSPLWNDVSAPFAHSLSAHTASAEPGFHRGGSTYGSSSNDFRLVQGANYNSAYIPDSILNAESTKNANAYGDFDNGVGTSRDGAYINKPDEGNLSQLQKNYGGKQVNIRNAYFVDSQYQAAATESFFTPNRMVTSPVMFGSLPTGVWGSRAAGGTVHPNAATIGVPWRTLLFRPHVKYPSVANSLNSHPGSPLHASAAGATPADHYLLELFRMPVVEPYAISDPFSTAGKINLNFQMVPFTHIKRATALHALMKGEVMRTVPKADASIYKNWRTTSSTDWDAYKMYSESEGTAKYWHRKIDVEKTLKQFDERFDFTAAKTGAKGLFRTASQICEVHLIPGRTNAAGDGALIPASIDSSNREQVMAKFWEANSMTGDNIREAPYSNLYARLTTQSNVFKVYVRAQIITKARSGDPAVFDPKKDSVTSAYRGSAIIERYIDAKDAAHPLPDYAAADDPFTPHPLSDYYRFRVVETKRFSP